MDSEHSPLQPEATAGSVEGPEEPQRKEEERKEEEDPSIASLEEHQAQENSGSDKDEGKQPASSENVLEAKDMEGIENEESTDAKPGTTDSDAQGSESLELKEESEDKERLGVSEELDTKLEKTVSVERNEGEEEHMDDSVPIPHDGSEEQNIEAVAESEESNEEKGNSGQTEVEEEDTETHKTVDEVKVNSEESEPPDQLGDHLHEDPDGSERGQENAVEESRPVVEGEEDHIVNQVEDQTEHDEEFGHDEDGSVSVSKMGTEDLHVSANLEEGEMSGPIEEIGKVLVDPNDDNINQIRKDYLESNEQFSKQKDEDKTSHRASVQRRLEERKKKKNAVQSEREQMLSIFAQYNSGLNLVFKRYSQSKVLSGQKATFEDISNRAEWMDFMEFYRMCQDFGIAHKKGLSRNQLKILFVEVARRGGNFQAIRFDHFRDVLVTSANVLLSNDPWKERYQSISERARALFHRMDLGDDRRAHLTKRMLAFGGFHSGDGKLAGHENAIIENLKAKEFSRFDFESQTSHVTETGQRITLLETFHKPGDPHTPESSAKRAPMKKQLAKPNQSKDRMKKEENITEMMQSGTVARPLNISNPYILDPDTEETLIHTFGLESKKEERSSPDMATDEVMALWDNVEVLDVFGGADPDIFSKVYGVHGQPSPANPSPRAYHNSPRQMPTDKSRSGHQKQSHERNLEYFWDPAMQFPVREQMSFLRPVLPFPDQYSSQEGPNHGVSRAHNVRGQPEAKSSWNEGSTNFYKDGGRQPQTNYHHHNEKQGANPERSFASHQVASSHRPENTEARLKQQQQSKSPARARPVQGAKVKEQSRRYPSKHSPQPPENFHARSHRHDGRASPSPRMKAHVLASSPSKAPPGRQSPEYIRKNAPLVVRDHPRAPKSHVPPGKH